MIAQDGRDLPLYLGINVDTLFFFSGRPAELQPTYDALVEFVHDQPGAYPHVYMLVSPEATASADGGGEFLSSLRAGHIEAYPGMVLRARVYDAVIYELTLEPMEH